MASKNAVSTTKKSRVFYGLGISSKGTIYTKKFQGSAARREWVAKANGRFDADAFRAAYGFDFPAGTVNRFALDYRTAARAVDAKKMDKTDAARELSTILCKVSGVNATPAAAPSLEKTPAPATVTPVQEEEEAPVITNPVVVEFPTPTKNPAPVVQETPAPSAPEIEFSLEELADFTPPVPVQEEEEAPAEDDALRNVNAYDLFSRVTSSFNFAPINAKKNNLWKPAGKLAIRNAAIAALDGCAVRFTSALNYYGTMPGFTLTYRMASGEMPAWISLRYERENKRRGKTVYCASIYYQSDNAAHMRDFVNIMNAALELCPSNCIDFDAAPAELPF